MYRQKTFSISSAFGAILAATLMTVVSALPEAVHAQDSTSVNCPRNVSDSFKPSLQ